jgi:hypothetical protein
VSKWRGGYREASTAGKRVARGVMRFNDAEWAIIVQVAAVADMRPGAWAQEAAHEAARREHRGELTDRTAVAELIDELREHRRILRNIGGNLNDVAKAANATGQIENAAVAAAVLRLVGNTVRASDTLVTGIRKEILS